MTRDGVAPHRPRASRIARWVRTTLFPLIVWLGSAACGTTTEPGEHVGSSALPATAPQIEPLWHVLDDPDEAGRMIVRAFDVERVRTVWTSPRVLDTSGSPAGSSTSIDLQVQPGSVRTVALGREVADLQFEAEVPRSLFPQAWSSGVGDEFRLPNGWTVGPLRGEVVSPSGEREDWGLWIEVAATGDCAAFLRRVEGTKDFSIELRQFGHPASRWRRAWSEVLGRDHVSTQPAGVAVSEYHVMVWDPPCVALLSARDGRTMWTVDLDDVLPQTRDEPWVERCGSAPLQGVLAGPHCFVASWRFAASLFIADGSVEFWLEYPKGLEAWPHLRGTGPVFLLTPRVVYLHHLGRTRLEPWSVDPK